MGQQSSAPAPHLCPARARLHEKVSLGLRASYHSSEPSGAAGWLQDILFKPSPSQSRLCPPRDGFESLPRAELGQQRHPCVPSGFRSVQVAPGFGRECRVVFNASRLVWLWGTLGRRTRMCCCHMSRIWFGDVDAPPPPLLPHHSLPLCCLLVLHTPMAITFSSSSRKWERPAACTAGCFSLLLSLSFCSGCRGPFLLTFIPSQQCFSSCASRVDGVLPFKSCVSVAPSHLLPCIICPCDGNVLVNCITDLLCVFVCLWGWFILFAGR